MLQPVIAVLKLTFENEMFTGTLIAFVVILLSTWSLITSLFATLSIASVMASVVGLTTMMGWELGTIQSILISILAGFSVDYVVHLAHAYSQASGASEDRVVAAFSEMGSPVLRSPSYRCLRTNSWFLL